MKDLRQVKCYAGCGQQYDATNEAVSSRHCSHAGDSGMPREQLLRILDELQAERDSWVRFGEQYA